MFTVATYSLVLKVLMKKTRLTLTIIGFIKTMILKNVILNLMTILMILPMIRKQCTLFLATLLKTLNTMNASLEVPPYVQLECAKNLGSKTVNAMMTTGQLKSI